MSAPSLHRESTDFLIYIALCNTWPDVYGYSEHVLVRISSKKKTST